MSGKPPANKKTPAKENAVAKQQGSKRVSLPNRPPLNEISSVQNGANDTLDGMEPTTSKNISADIQKRIISEPFYNNNYPQDICSHIERKFFKVAPFGERAEQSTAEYDEQCETKCIFCQSAENQEKDDLISCQGTMESNPEGSKKRNLACKSKFHVTCALNHNASGYLFQYAALPECQNKLLCPLHCCSSCNNEHYRQVAHHGDIIECILCMRSFHRDWCTPAGSKLIDIYVNLEGNQTKFEMLVCPSHKGDPKSTKHIASCDECQQKKDLIECRSCCRSFHVGCQDVKRLNKQPLPTDRCEKCITGETIRYDVPVLALWTDGKFYLAMTRDWYMYPSAARERSRNYDRVGYVVVEYISSLAEVSPSRRQFSIVPIGDVAPIVESYFSTAPNQKMMEVWRETAHKCDIYSRLPTLYKTVNKHVKTSKCMKNVQMKQHECYETVLCACKGPDRCTTEACAYVALGCECPAFCEGEGRVCHNRKISTSFVNPSVEMRRAGKKGFGVFAIKPLKEDEFIAEYAGEIINKKEEERRKLIADSSRDFQANHYTMKLSEGMSVDAARIGNIARYINHSCAPNARAEVFKIHSKGDAKMKGECIYYENRLYIKCGRDIAAGEEITFNYMMDNGGNRQLPTCYCGVDNCKGVMSNRKNGKVGGSIQAEDSQKDIPNDSKKLKKNQEKKVRRESIDLKQSQKQLKRKNSEKKLTAPVAEEESPVKRRASGVRRSGRLHFEDTENVLDDAINQTDSQNTPGTSSQSERHAEARPSARRRSSGASSSARASSSATPKPPTPRSQEVRRSGRGLIPKIEK